MECKRRIVPWVAIGNRDKAEGDENVQPLLKPFSVRTYHVSISQSNESRCLIRLQESIHYLHLNFGHTLELR